MDTKKNEPRMDRPSRKTRRASCSAPRVATTYLRKSAFIRGLYFSPVFVPFALFRDYYPNPTLRHVFR
jgi:hypothetical protein